MFMLHRRCLMGRKKSTRTRESNRLVSVAKKLACKKLCRSGVGRHSSFCCRLPDIYPLNEDITRGSPEGLQRHVDTPTPSFHSSTFLFCPRSCSPFSLYRLLSYTRTEIFSSLSSLRHTRAFLHSPLFITMVPVVIQEESVVFKAPDSWHTLQTFKGNQKKSSLNITFCEFHFPNYTLKICPRRRTALVQE